MLNFDEDDKHKHNLKKPIETNHHSFKATNPETFNSVPFKKESFVSQEVVHNFIDNLIEENHIFSVEMINRKLIEKFQDAIIALQSLRKIQTSSEEKKEVSIEIF